MDRNNIDNNWYITSNDNDCYPSSIINKIEKFSSFTNGWHYGEGESFDQKTINDAKEICIFLYDHLIYSIDVFPGFSGELLVKLYFDTSAVEVFFKKDKLPNYIVLDKSDNELFASADFTINDLKKQLLQQRQRWTILESYPYTTTKEGTKDLTALHLKTRPEMEESRLSHANVQIGFLGECVSILEKTSPSTPILLYTSNLARTYYLLGVSLI